LAQCKNILLTAILHAFHLSFARQYYLTRSHILDRRGFFIKSRVDTHEKWQKNHTVCVCGAFVCVCAIGVVSHVRFLFLSDLTFLQKNTCFRFGIFDELGFLGDPLYPNYYKVAGRILPTGKIMIKKICFYL
jgi:hypothetical protein